MLPGKLSDMNFLRSSILDGSSLLEVILEFKYLTRSAKKNFLRNGVTALDTSTFN